MAEKTEFEEPEYEGALYNQLLNQDLRIWTPGRVFERIIGIDSAIYANNLIFWSLFNYQGPLIGVNLRQVNLRFLFRWFQKRIRPFPTFKVNLLIQSKRPSHRNGVNATYALNGIKGQYWQFKTKQHQQAILEKLELQLGKNALVVYACSVFHKFDDLDRYIQQGQIIENSTFVKPNVLSGHGKWVFDTPGTTGLACSKIKKHEDISFAEMLKKLKEDSNEDIKNQEISDLDSLINIINKICEEQQSNPLIKAYLRRKEILKTVEEEYFFDNKEKREVEIFFNFLSFNLFTSIINVRWFSIE